MLTRLFSNTFKNPPNTKCVIWFVTLVSGLVASWLILLEGGRIGDDSVLYLEVARLFSIGAWKDGIALYHWPLYPALITLVHQLTGLNLQYSALLLSVPLYMLASYAFCRLIIEAGGHSKTLWAGALLLFSCTYITRDILPMIMRDQGFWAFYLCSLLFLLRFYKQNRWQDSLLWQVCTIVAVLFRVEGITYLMLLPFIMLTRTECSLRERVKHLAAAQSLTLLGAVTVILGLLTIPSLKFSDLGRLDESFTVLQRAYLQLSHGLIDKAHIIGDQVLGSFLSDYGMQGLILTLIAIIIGKVAGASGWPSLLLACMPIKPDNPSPGTEVRRFFYWVMGLGLVNLCVILLS
ncbi:MAG: glycosyltransferase family 39 protein, partial [Methylophilaceae bacterium]